MIKPLLCPAWSPDQNAQRTFVTGFLNVLCFVLDTNLMLWCEMNLFWKWQYKQYKWCILKLSKYWVGHELIQQDIWGVPGTAWHPSERKQYSHGDPERDRLFDQIHPTQGLMQWRSKIVIIPTCKGAKGKDVRWKGQRPASGPTWEGSQLWTWWPHAVQPDGTTRREGRKKKSRMKVEESDWELGSGVSVDRHSRKETGGGGGGDKAEVTVNCCGLAFSLRPITTCQTAVLEQTHALTHTLPPQWYGHTK